MCVGREEEGGGGGGRGRGAGEGILNAWITCACSCMRPPALLCCCFLAASCICFNLPLVAAITVRSRSGEAPDTAIMGEDSVLPCGVWRTARVWRIACVHVCVWRIMCVCVRVYVCVSINSGVVIVIPSRGLHAGATQTRPPSSFDDTAALFARGEEEEGRVGGWAPCQNI